MGTEEKWKDIVGYEGIYQVSNLGRVKSLSNNFSRKEKILKNHKNSGGYLRVVLSKNRKVKRYYIHRLVSEYFIDNPNNLPQTDHINTDRTDNRVENLRWVTHKENMNNPLTIDKINKMNKRSSKPIIQFSKDGEFIRKWDSAMDAQRELGIKQGGIRECCKGKRKTAGGYIWRYYYKGIWIKNHIPLKDKMVS